MDRNEGLCSILHGKLNSLAQCAKDYSNTDGIPMLSACVDMVEVGLDLIYMRMLKAPRSPAFPEHAAYPIG